MTLQQQADQLKIQIQSSDGGSAIMDIFKKLDQRGQLCWLAGGAVRDFLLGKASEDFDLVTDASEEQILQLFPNAILTGRQFGVYKIPFLIQQTNLIIDLAVFRTEDIYTDGRHPKTVRPSSPELDAKRRDFTINAIYFDLKHNAFVDFMDGLKDLENKLLKTVGDPQNRFTEDYLRLLRLVRFKAQLGFTVEEQTLAAAFANAQLITQVSGERISDELIKVIKHKKSEEFWAQKLTQELFKSLNFNYDISDFSEALILQSYEPRAQLVFQLVILSKYNESVVLFIKEKLKLAKADVKLAQKIINIYHRVTLNTESIYSWSLFLEKEAGQDLVHQSWAFIILDFFWRKKNLNINPKDMILLLKKADKPFFTGAEIQSVCPAQKISTMLDQIRLLQFMGQVKTKEEALSFIVKNHSKAINSK